MCILGIAQNVQPKFYEILTVYIKFGMHSDQHDKKTPFSCLPDVHVISPALAGWGNFYYMSF